MTDENLIARLRGAPADTRGNKNLCLDAADRIEALVETATRYRDERAMVDDTPAFCAFDAALRAVEP